jgi:hypothetical protein
MVDLKPGALPCNRGIIQCHRKLTWEFRTTYSDWRTQGYWSNANHHASPHCYLSRWQEERLLACPGPTGSQQWHYHIVPSSS